jgi:hypothetical protein
MRKKSRRSDFLKRLFGRRRSRESYIVQTTQSRAFPDRRRHPDHDVV